MPRQADIVERVRVAAARVAQGFGLAARIVSFDDEGAIGDIGLYLTWGE